MNKSEEELAVFWVVCVVIFIVEIIVTTYSPSMIMLFIISLSVASIIRSLVGRVWDKRRLKEAVNTQSNCSVNRSATSATKS